MEMLPDITLRYCISLSLLSQCAIEKGKLRCHFNDDGKMVWETKTKDWSWRHGMARYYSMLEWMLRLCRARLGMIRDDEESEEYEPRGWMRVCCCCCQ